MQIQIYAQNSNYDTKILQRLKKNREHSHCGSWYLLLRPNNNIGTVCTAVVHSFFLQIVEFPTETLKSCSEVLGLIPSTGPQ